MNEEKLEEGIEHIAIYSLRALKTLFLEQKLSDREATLALAFYIQKFTQHGYLKNKPVDVLKNVSEIIEEVGGNVTLNLKHKRGND